VKLHGNHRDDPRGLNPKRREGDLASQRYRFPVSKKFLWGGKEALEVLENAGRAREEFKRLHSLLK
jgi:hypothetical protein